MSTLEINDHEEQEYPYDENHGEFYDDDQPEDVNVVAWKIGAFLTIPILEIIAQCIFTSDGERAILVAPAFTLVMFYACFDLISQARLRQSEHPASMRYWFSIGMWLGGLGLFAIALSVVWKNELYFIAADVFHWYVEFLGVAFLGVWACSSYSSQVVARAFSKACLFMALIGAAVVLFGVVGVLPAGYGGKPVEGLARWRLELGRGFPLIPLIISFATLLFAPRTYRRLPLLSLFTIFLLLISLAFTLKRTQWLLFPVCLVGLLLPKRAYFPLIFLSVLSMTLLWVFHVVSPTTLPEKIDQIKQMLTYNDDWTIDDTLDNRQAQVDETMKVATKEWWGHGFGAEVKIPTPNGKRIETLHYVHSLYAYYALQFGAIGCLVAMGICGALVFGLFVTLDTNPEAQWLIRAALFSIFALLGSGLMMVSIHTTIAGVVLAMAVVGLSRCISPHPLDRFHEHQEDYDEYGQYDHDNEDETESEHESQTEEEYEDETHPHIT